MNTSDWPMPAANTSRASSRSSVSRERCDRVSGGLPQWKLPNMERNKRCRDRRAIFHTLAAEALSEPRRFACGAAITTFQDSI